MHSIDIFFVLAQAYDTVSRTVLLRKLEILGLRGTQLALFEDYLRTDNNVLKLDH